MSDTTTVVVRTGGDATTVQAGAASTTIVAATPDASEITVVGEIGPPGPQGPAGIVFDSTAGAGTTLFVRTLAEDPTASMVDGDLWLVYVHP